ncbi:hypothetical protein D3C86_1279730 [compost metagenome]
MTEIKSFAFDSIAAVDLAGLLVVVLESRREIRCDGFERQTAFRALRTGHGGHDVTKIEFQRVGEDEVGTIAGAPHVLRLGIGFDERDTILGTAGHGQVVDGFAVNREEAAGRAIFRAHIADGRTVGQRHRIKAGAEEFDELRYHALLTQHLHDRQNEVGRGDAFLHLAGQLEADDLGQKHGDRLAEHGSFGFDTADTPAENAETVDHGRMRIRADAGIRISDRLAVLLLRPDGLAEIFEVDLVTDACAGRNHAEILERLLAPLQEAVTLAVALIFQFNVAGKGARRAEFIDDNRVVNDEIDGNQRIDLFRIAAKSLDTVTHGGKINHGGNTGEVLHENAGGAVGDFGFGQALVTKPFGHRKDMFLGDGLAVLETQQVFQKNLHGIGQLGNALQAIGFSLGKAEIDVILTANGKDGTTFETVE